MCKCCDVIDKNEVASNSASEQCLGAGHRAATCASGSAAKGLRPIALALRSATDADVSALWAIFQPIAAAGDAYAYDETTTREDFERLWLRPPSQAFVALLDGEIAGSYFIRPNQPGRGAHVANAGYMTSVSQRGRGVAAAMCEHSLVTARAAGFSAMQFNFVVATNVTAVSVWERFGFAVVGRVPRAFRHATLGEVDVLVMHRFLDEDAVPQAGRAPSSGSK
jgi:ribosomal protein S18 acetylase RimI-like enzyme